MAELCREFGMSRKTGYKIFDRYQERGVSDPRRKWCAQGDDFRTFLADFVAALPHIAFPE
jgi:hypothetical protein